MNPETFEEQAHKFGARTAERIGSAVDKAGTKVDAAIDYIGDKTQKVTDKIQTAGQEGWDGVRRRTTDCVRNAPLATFFVTIGAGILIGLLLRRHNR